jgi:hypothetical protein
MEFQQVQLKLILYQKVGTFKGNLKMVRLMEMVHFIILNKTINIVDNGRVQDLIKEY